MHHRVRGRTGRAGLPRSSRSRHNPLASKLPKFLALWALPMLLCALVPARATRRHGVENETKADKDLRQIILGDNVDKVRDRSSIAPP